MDNLFFYTFLVMVVVTVAYFAWDFFRKPTPEQKQKVIEWLKYAVFLAEQELGSGTGQLKLRQVYNDFISTFPDIAKIVSFPTFSAWVDSALAWLKIQLENNKNIKELVEK